MAQNQSEKYINGAILQSGGISNVQTNMPLQYVDRQKQYMAKRSRQFVSERAKYASDYVQAEVQGIAKDDLQDIWNRYYRVKENHQRPVKGTGLGLNIVKIILKNHSFDYGVESELDKGSTFWVDFPSVPEKMEEN